MPQQENTSKLTINGNYAIVKYELGWSLRDLLQIYGIPEKRTDLVRSVLKGNDLAYNNNVLTLSNGRPIPQGKIIQMPTRVVSPSILEKVKAGDKPAAASPAAKTSAANASSAPSSRSPQGKSSEFLNTLSLLWQDKTTRWVVYGGTTALAIALVTGIVITVIGDRTAESNAISQKETEAADTKITRSSKNTQRADSTARADAGKREFSAKSNPAANLSRPGGKELAASKNTPAASTPSVVSLEPGKDNIDMRNVGTLEISQNSSKEEIVRVIQAFNELHSPKKK